MHSFVSTFVNDELLRDFAKDKRLAIVKSYADYAFVKATEAHRVLQSQLADRKSPADPDSEQLSNVVFRYAIPASKLLRTLGDIDRAQLLPMQAQGTLREMVFFFYQVAKDYRKALDYAAQWLQISPDDREIMLYQARCYRNLRTTEGWRAADATLDKIEISPLSGRFRARVLRERALVADGRGNAPEARRFFEEGIALSRDARYPENHVGLAMLLLRETDENLELNAVPHDVTRALSLLEQASQSATFDRFYLGLFVEALVRAGRENDAYPLLEEALARDPTEPRLNYWFAEAARRQGQFDLAIEYGRRAVSGGVRKGAFTLANALCSSAMADGSPQGLRAKLASALEVMSKFEPEFGTDHEVAAAIRAKICRLQNDWDAVRVHISPYEGSDNSYSVYEQTLLDFTQLDQAVAAGDMTTAREGTERARQRLMRVSAKRRLPPQLEELLAQANSRLADIQQRPDTRSTK
jgi:tetratricopeptide (TPR) repeat protein